MRGRVARALREESPLAVDTPLPADTLEEAFARDSPPASRREFWQQQLSRVEQLVNDSKLAQEKWSDTIPDGIKPSAGKLQTVALSQLMRQFGIKCQRWIRQFSAGFPITGSLSQREDFPPDGEEAEQLPRAHLFTTAPKRFRERAAQSGYANAQQLRGEAPAQIENGWRPHLSSWAPPGNRTDGLMIDAILRSDSELTGQQAARLR